MRQSVFLALIGASSAIRISQTTKGACTWSSSAGHSGNGCTNGDAKCGSTAEQNAQPTASPVAASSRSCDPALALAQGACTWSSAAGHSGNGCTNGNAKCGSQAEKDAQPTASPVAASSRSCDPAKAL